MPMAAIRAFCEKWDVLEFALFGSVLREDFRPRSDVDVVVTLPEDSRCGLFKLGEMSEDLADIFGRRVDLYTRKGVEVGMGRSDGLAERIAESMKVIYSRGA